MKQAAENVTRSFRAVENSPMCVRVSTGSDVADALSAKLRHIQAIVQLLEGDASASERDLAEANALSAIGDIAAECLALGEALWAQVKTTAEPWQQLPPNRSA